MKNIYSYISNISLLNSNSRTLDDFILLDQKKIFEDEKSWPSYQLSPVIAELGSSINSRVRNRMSQLSLGVFDVLNNGPGKTMTDDEELFLFSGFGEIETTYQIIKNILIDHYMVVSPTLFHNSVHHTPLGYYTILKGRHNPCVTISDGLFTGISFINYIKKRIKINKNFVVACGEEYSQFYKLDSTESFQIMPVFAAFRIQPFSLKGFCYHGWVNVLDELKKLDIFTKADYIFTDKDLFFALKEESKKKIMTEYPLVLDNPCGLLIRLILPFYLNLTGISLVVGQFRGKIHYFEVLL